MVTYSLREADSLSRCRIEARGSLIIHHWSYTSGGSSNWSCICLSVHLSVQIDISVTANRNVFILAMMMGYGHGLWSGHDAHSFKILIRSGIPDTQTKISVFEKVPII